MLPILSNKILLFSAMAYSFASSIFFKFSASIIYIWKEKLLFSASINYMWKKIIKWLVSFFTLICFQFTITLVMTICDMLFEFLHFQAIYFQTYWLEQSSFWIICTKWLQLTISQILGVQKVFDEKLLARMN